MPIFQHIIDGRGVWRRAFKTFRATGRARCPSSRSGCSVRVRGSVPFVDEGRQHLGPQLGQHQLEDAHAGEAEDQDGRRNILKVTCFEYCKNAK